MLAAWMALERRSLSLVDPLDFIVTVNKGIEPTFSQSGLMVRSLPATSTQLGLVLQAAVVIVTEKLSAELSTLRARHGSTAIKRRRRSKTFFWLLAYPQLIYSFCRSFLRIDLTHCSSGKYSAADSERQIDDLDPLVGVDDAFTPPRGQDQRTAFPRRLPAWIFPQTSIF
jgi:hypothetical protein